MKKILYCYLLLIIYILLSYNVTNGQSNVRFTIEYDCYMSYEYYAKQSIKKLDISFDMKAVDINYLPVRVFLEKYNSDGTFTNRVMIYYNNSEGVYFSDSKGIIRLSNLEIPCELNKSTNVIRVQVNGVSSNMLNLSSSHYVYEADVRCIYDGDLANSQVFGNQLINIPMRYNLIYGCIPDNVKISAYLLDGSSLTSDKPEERKIGTLSVVPEYQNSCNPNYDYYTNKTITGTIPSLNENCIRKYIHLVWDDTKVLIDKNEAKINAPDPHRKSFIAIPVYYVSNTVQFLPTDTVNNGEIKIIDGVKGIYAANGSARTYTINSGGTSYFEANEFIILQAGFHSKYGSDFNAKIKACKKIVSPTINAEIEDNGFIVNNEYYDDNVKLKNSYEQEIYKDFIYYIYPNPANDMINIEISEINENCTIEIFNSLGIIIFTDILKSNNYQLNISNQPSGIYFLKIYNGRDVHTERIIKK